MTTERSGQKTAMTAMNEHNDQHDGFLEGLEPELAVLFARLEVALRLEHGEIPSDLVERVMGALRLEHQIESDPLAEGLSGALGVGEISMPAGLGDRVFAAVEASGCDELEREFELAELGGLDEHGGDLAAALAASKAPAGLTDRIAAATLGEPVGAGEHDAVIGKIDSRAGVHSGVGGSSSGWTGWFAAAAAVALLATVGWVTLQTERVIDGPVATNGTGEAAAGGEVGVDQLAAQLTEFLGSDSDDGDAVDAEMLAMSVELDEYAMNWAFGGGSAFDDTAQVVNDLHILETSFGSY